jgi:hypothetical protein
VHIELYPQGPQLPPTLAADAGLMGRAWWTLELRWFAWRHTDFPGHAPARIRIFVLYHDPSTLERVPDSHGLQKGLVGVVQAFADEALAGSNAMVIAHELMHTVGASDKYDASGLPCIRSASPTRSRSRSIRRRRPSSWPGGARRGHRGADPAEPESLCRPATALEIRGRP